MSEAYNDLLENTVSEATYKAAHRHQLAWMNWAYAVTQTSQRPPRPEVSAELKVLVKGEPEAFKREFLKQELTWRTWADKAAGHYPP